MRWRVVLRWGESTPLSVVDGLRLEQHDPRLFLGTRLVFYTVWHHNHVSLTDALRSVAEVHGQFPLEHKEELVFVVVGMPHKIPLDLRDFDVLPVQSGHDPGVPVVVDQINLEARSIGSMGGKSVFLGELAGTLPALWIDHELNEVELHVLQAQGVVGFSMVELELGRDAQVGAQHPKIALLAGANVPPKYDVPGHCIEGEVGELVPGVPLFKANALPRGPHPT